MIFLVCEGPAGDLLQVGLPVVVQQHLVLADVYNLFIQALPLNLLRWQTVDGKLALLRL